MGRGGTNMRSAQKGLQTTGPLKYDDWLKEKLLETMNVHSFRLVSVWAHGTITIYRSFLIQGLHLLLSVGTPAAG